jgi:Holliday junction resolvase RusA-like endonuclease
MKIEFTAIGKAQPAGSKKGFIVKMKDGKQRAIVTDDNTKSKPWQAVVSDAAGDAYTGPLLNGPLKVAFHFFRPRPKGHFKAGGKLSKLGQESIGPMTKPDLLKLSRGVEDALTGVIWRDDSQIIAEELHKDWGEPARVEVSIEEILLRNEIRDPIEGRLFTDANTSLSKVRRQRKAV